MASFTCDEGFLLEGNETISCLSTGNWSDLVPICKSIHECIALNVPENGKLIYASDSGIIKMNLSSYPIGTFAEIQCNEGFEFDGENLISCTETGEWDIEVENCTAVDIPKKKEMPGGFLRDFREFLFESCNVDDINNVPKLCSKFTPIFNTSLMTFEMPESAEYEGMDLKLLNMIENMKSDEMKSIDIKNFLQSIIKSHHDIVSTRDAYRFIICLYIDLIIMDKEIGVGLMEDTSMETINDKIKKVLESVIEVAYHNTDNL